MPFDAECTMESEREIENHEDLLVTQSSLSKMQSNGCHTSTKTDKENANPNSNGTVRRHDEPSELSFEPSKLNKRNPFQLCMNFPDR